MKGIKITDAFISLAMLVLFSIRYILDNSFASLSESYFIVGSWQSISMLVHAYHGWHTRKWSLRYVYHWISFISLITLPLGFYWILIFAAPGMAGFYTTLCFIEISNREKRPSELLGK